MTLFSRKRTTTLPNVRREYFTPRSPKRKFKEIKQRENKQRPDRNGLSDFLPFEQLRERDVEQSTFSTNIREILSHKIVQETLWSTSSWDKYITVEMEKENKASRGSRRMYETGEQTWRKWREMTSIRCRGNGYGSETRFERRARRIGGGRGKYKDLRSVEVHGQRWVDPIHVQSSPQRWLH